MKSSLSFNQSEQKLTYTLDCDYNSLDDLEADTTKSICLTRPSSLSRSYVKSLALPTKLDISNIPYTQDKVYLYKLDSSVIGVITNTQNEVTSGDHFFFGALTKNGMQIKGIVTGTDSTTYGSLIAKKVPKDLQVPVFKDYLISNYQIGTKIPFSDYTKFTKGPSNSWTVTDVEIFP